MLLVLAYGLWRRGTETRLLPRLRRLPVRLRWRGGPADGWGARRLRGHRELHLRQHQRLEPVPHPDRQREVAGRLREALLPFENTPQPKIVAMTLEVDLKPHAPSLETKGSYVIENKTAEPLKEIHVRFDRDLDVLALSIEGARPKKTFERFNYRIFAFDTPMAPGERRKMSFITRAQRASRTADQERGWSTTGPSSTTCEIAPILGMAATACCRTAPSAASTACRPSCAWPSWATPVADQFNGLRKDADFVASDIT
jgi:ABC-2 type transport system permease protein